MKTTTLTIRLSANDKQLLQTAARGRGLTVTEYLVQLVHTDAGPGQTAVNDLRAEMNQLSADLADLRAQIAALAPHTQRECNDKQCKRTDRDAAYDPWLDECPGQTKDCNPSCRWFCEGDCQHPDYEDWENISIRGDCPKYEPRE